MSGDPAAGDPAAADRDAVGRLLDLAATGRVAAAVALLDGWLDAGWPVTRILAEVVVPAQHEAGRRWQRGDWSISREHTVSSVIDTLVGVLGLRVSYDRATAPGAPVLVVCAEGEWHTLVARVIAEGLRAEGVPVHLLGGSVPARDLAAEAEDAGCSAAIVCCAVPMHLPGAQRSVAALREAGRPVLAAGRGFGPDDRRARAIGADGWAADLASGLALLEGWERRPPPRAPTPAPAAEVEALATRAVAIVGDGEAELARRWPPLEALSPSARERTREDLHYTLRFLAATVLTDDHRLLVDYLDWLVEILTSRGVPAGTVPLSLECLLAALPDDLPQSRRHLTAAVEGWVPAGA